MSSSKRGISIRRRSAAAVASAVLAVVGVALGPAVTPARAATAQVTAANLTFTPPTVTVEMEPGEPGFPGPHAHVDFVMNDPGVDHTVAFDDVSVASPSGRLSFGQVYNVVFEGIGTYTYRCEIHPAMSGTVIVKELPKPKEEDSDSGPGTTLVILVTAVVATAVTAGVAFLLTRRRREPAPPAGSGRRSTR